MRSCRATASSSYLMPNGKGKKSWTSEEDEKLRDLIQIHGTLNWTLVAQLLLDPNDPTGGRSGKQCRERWHNHLNPSISKVEWTQHEDATIIYLQKKWGNQWAKIAKYCPGRSDNAIKNRYHATCRNKHMQVDLSELNLPLFIEDAEAVYESSERASEATWTTGEKASDEEFDDDEEELDFDQHVSKIKSYTTSLPVPIGGQHTPHDETLRDDIATSPLTNASMSIGGLDLDEMLDGGYEQDPDSHLGGGMGGINVDPVNFSAYKWGAAHDEAPAAGCFSGLSGFGSNGFCGMGMGSGMAAPNVAPVPFTSSMTAFCDFNMGGSHDHEEQMYNQENFAQPAFMCDEVEAAPYHHQQQQHQQQQHFFSPSSVFCAPR